VRQFNRLGIRARDALDALEFDGLTQGVRSTMRSLDQAAVKWGLYVGPASDGTTAVTLLRAFLGRLETYRRTELQQDIQAALALRSAYPAMSLWGIIGKVISGSNPADALLAVHAERLRMLASGIAIELPVTPFISASTQVVAGEMTGYDVLDSCPGTALAAGAYAADSAASSNRVTTIIPAGSTIQDVAAGLPTHCHFWESVDRHIKLVAMNNSGGVIAPIGRWRIRLPMAGSLAIVAKSEEAIVQAPGARIDHNLNGRTFVVNIDGLAPAAFNMTVSNNATTSLAYALPSGVTNLVITATMPNPSAATFHFDFVYTPPATVSIAFLLSSTANFSDSGLLSQQMKNWSMYELAGYGSFRQLLIDTHARLFPTAAALIPPNSQLSAASVKEFYNASGATLAIRNRVFFVALGEVAEMPTFQY
jgi:hypothetical protein